MKIPIFLGLFTALMYTNLDAVIHHMQLWKHPKDGHIVLNLGDTHVDDHRSAGQQYDILNLAGRTRSRIICEDSCYSIGSYLFADSPVKYRNILGLHIWAQIAGCDSVNVEFRWPYTAEHSFSYAKRVISAVDELETIDDEHTPYYQETLKIFNDSTRQSLQNLRSLKYLFCSAGRAMQKAANTDDNTHALHSPMFNLNNTVLDMKILQQIAETRKDNTIAIVSAGSWHTRNIGTYLERNGYKCLEQKSDTLVEAAEKDEMLDTKVAETRGSYRAFFNPVSIPDAHREVLQHTKQYTPSLQSQVALSYLHTRAKIEASSLGYALYKSQPIIKYARLGVPTGALLLLGLSTLVAGCEIVKILKEPREHSLKIYYKGKRIF